MSCRERREIISAYVDGEIPPEEARLLEEHLAGCAGCRDLVRRMRTLDEGLALSGGDVPPGFRERVFARLDREGLLPRPRILPASWLRWAPVPLAAAAAAVLLVLAVREGPIGPAPSAPPAARSVSRAPESAAPTTPARGPGARAAAPGHGSETTARNGRELSAEDREIVANLEILEDPALIEGAGEESDWELLEPGDRERG